MGKYDFGGRLDIKVFSFGRYREMWQVWIFEVLVHEL